MPVTEKTAVVTNRAIEHSVLTNHAACTLTMPWNSTKSDDKSDPEATCANYTRQTHILDIGFFQFFTTGPAHVLERTDVMFNISQFTVR